MTRKVLYLSGTRADFGLMRRALGCIEAHPELELAVCLCGTHLEPQFGATGVEVESCGFTIVGRVDMRLSDAGAGTMVAGIGHAVLGLVPVMEMYRPDVLLLLGDRGEMLAGALVALHLGIPIVHVCGGDLSGTVDEPVRHAISKLSHHHLVASEESQARLIRMGEHAGQIRVVGMPGLDGLLPRTVDRSALCRELGFDDARPLVLALFHPVVQEAHAAGQQMAAILDAVEESGAQVICLEPNSDTGHELVRDAIAARAARARIRVFKHMNRERFLDVMACVDLMIGNSSSGIIESTLFGLPVINVGSRQSGRQRGGNIVDCAPDRAALARAIEVALGSERRTWSSPYGDGRAGERIAEYIARMSLEPALLQKQNSY